MDAWRAAVLRAAESWLRTPWAHNQCIKGDGGGVDCGRFIMASYDEADLVPSVELGEYQSDWMFHQSEERYLALIQERLDLVEVPKPADVVLWRFGKCFSHGGIVVEWPVIIHSFLPEKNVCYGDGERGVLQREHLPGGGNVQRVRAFYSLEARL